MFREELRRTDAEEELDVDTCVLPVGDDEFGFVNPAADIASAIERILPRPVVCNEDGEPIEITTDMIVEK